MEKKFALYAYAKNREMADYYYLQLFFYVVEELEQTMEDVEFFIDCGEMNTPAKDNLIYRINEFKAVIAPSYQHFVNVYEAYKLMYEELFIKNGLYCIYLDEEEYSFEAI